MKTTVNIDGKVYQVILSPLRDAQGRVVDFKVISTSQLLTRAPVRLGFMPQNTKPYGGT